MAGGRKKGIEAGRAHVKAFWDGSAIERGLGKMKSMIRGASDQLASIGTKMIGLGVGLGSLFAAPLKRAAEMELLEADLAVLLGSVAEAKKALADWRKFAAETPLEFKDVAELGKQLLNWKLATKDNVVEVLRQIGDASGGIPERMDGVIRALGQMRANGKILSEEMNQLTERGVPAWDLLAKVLGTDVRGAMELVRSGAVDASTAVPALIAALGEFGRGRMAAMAKTLIGRFSQLKDAIWEAVTPIGEALLPYAGRLASLASGLVERIGAWIKANAGLAAKLAAVAVALVVVGSAAVTVAAAMRAAMFAVTGLAMAIRGILFPVTLAITAAVRVLQGTIALFSGALLAARGAVVAVGGALHALGLIASITSSILTVATWAMVALRRSTTLTAAAIAAASALVNAFRFAVWATQGAVIVFAGSLKLAAGALMLLSATFALLANPVVAAVAAIAALGAGLYLLMQQGVTVGGVIDWMRDKFGPLAKTVMEVLRVIHDAMMAGQMAAAAKVMWAAVQLAFAHGINWIRGAWIDLKTFLASTMIDVAAQIETVWAVLSATIVKTLASAMSQALGLIANTAKALGKFAGPVGMLIGAKAGQVSQSLAGAARQSGIIGQVTGIEQGRRDTQAALAEDAARERAKLEGATADEASALAAAMADARTATEAANKAIEVPDAGSTAFDPVGIGATESATKKRKVTAGDAINTAAVVGTVSGGETLAKALAGRRDGTEAAVKAGNQTLKAIERKLGRPVWVGEGQTR